jgi:2-keto-3-deoxy-L-rhamnonate aldolase RhmA
MSALREGRPAFGTALHSADPAILEIAALVGYDWVSIILEHCALDLTEVATLQRAADSRGITTLIHVANAHDTRILPLLNEGVGGIVAPQVSDPADVAALVDEVRFPPLGQRGAASAVRSADYGLQPYTEYAQAANHSVAVGAIVESLAGVQAAEEIFAVPGLTFAYIGLMDLTQALGCPGEFRHPDVRATIERVIAAAQRHGIAIGLSEYGYSAAELLELGARMIITPSSEYAVLREGLRERLAQARDAAGLPPL